MVEVEAGFKIKETKEEAEKILLDNGFVNTYKNAKVRDIYFGKNVDLADKTEEEIKRSLVRCRNFETFENLQLLSPEFAEGKHKVDLRTAIKICDRLLENGFDIVFDTEKSDWIYQKGKSCHQLQDIKDIGLVDYVYNEEILGKNYSEAEQFEMLKQQMKDLNFTLEYDKGVDKLRSLYCGEVKLSTNQIGQYNYQEKSKG
jgi:adenylate cyclase class IV